MKKNLVRTTTAAVLLASSILVATPNAFAKTDTLDQSIHTLKMELNNAAKQYVNPAIGGKLAPSDLLYPTLNSAKKNYETTRKSIVASKLSTKEKESKLKEIDALYNEKIVEGLLPYMDAYNYAAKYLVPIMNEIKVAEENNDLAALEKGYHKLSAQLKERTAILYRFSGKAARDLLLQQFKTPADAIRDELMLPVTAYMKLAELQGLYASGKLAEAVKVYEELKALSANLPNASTNKFSAGLQQELKKVEALVDTEPTTSVEQQTLDAKVASLVTTLNTSNEKNLIFSSPVSNSLIIEVNEDVDILAFFSEEFYKSLVSNLGITKIYGTDALSEEAVNGLQTVLSTNAKTLAELKGKTITLPITVNNGKELDVNFMLTFQ